jgi:hypothetical protein
MYLPSLIDNPFALAAFDKLPIPVVYFPDDDIVGFSDEVVFV